MNDKLTIRQHRVIRGLTIENVAKEVGITREHLGKAENDFNVLRSMKTSTVIKISDVYKINLSDIIFFNSDTTQNGIQ